MTTWKDAFREGAVSGSLASILPAVAGAVIVASVACVVDFKFTPKRLTPGFEHRLGRPEMANVYACFALGLMIGSMMMRKR